jgi:GlpG protein
MEPASTAASPDGPPATFTLSGYKPLVVSGTVLVAISLFCGLNTEDLPLTWEAYGRWGAPSAAAIWDGAIWGLVSSSFVHLAIWHLVFNLYWFWILGRKVKFEMGQGFTLGLLLSAAFTTGVAELAVADTTGIGLSGVVYALVGFTVVKARNDSRFRGFLAPRTVRLFAIWLFVCILLTASDVLPVSNAGHFAGLAWGVFAAWLHTKRPLQRYGLGALVLGALSVPVCWAPWSVGWLSNRAYALHAANQLGQAKQYYHLILQRDSANQFAQANLKDITVFELGKQAQQAYMKGQLVQGRLLCQQILRLEPTNAWAQAMVQAGTAPVAPLP